MRERAAELTSRAESLNASRIEVFGGTQLELIGTERIRTENNCVPRDIVSLNSDEHGGLMLFGYNVFVGMRQETTVADVFSVHQFARGGAAGDDGAAGAFR
ncbi:DNA repair ATPase, partial [Phytoactinopolyspora endophytica]|uniref:DNA repair ATPase n=1 Tax=Phytoactinopolyspora endophytica TaxID=1642495 RepID=UPI003B82E74A